MSSQEQTNQTAKGASQRLGLTAEYLVGHILSKHGHKVARAEYNDPYDLLVNNSLRVEVKSAEMQMVSNSPMWKFNIHRHGRLNESRVDYYILRLENVPYFKNAIHLLFKAPIGKFTVNVSLRSLLQQHAPRATAFKRFCAKGKRASNGARSE